MAEGQLKALLRGVEAERGAIVTCRDPSALEMLLRLGNTDANQGSISVMFQKKNSNNGGSAGGSTAQLLFVNERFAPALEAEVQSWLDPFQAAAPAASPTTSGKPRKRTRGDDSSESSLESDSDSS